MTKSHLPTYGTIVCYNIFRQNRVDPCIEVGGTYGFRWIFKSCGQIYLTYYHECTTFWPQIIGADQWFSLGAPVSSTNKIDRHNITEILLKVALKAIDQIKPINSILVLII
jgi:hypothetical protein